METPECVREAARKHVTERAVLQVANNRMWMLAGGLLLLLGGSLALNWRQHIEASKHPIVVLRVDAMGRAKASTESAEEYVPQDAEVKFFLSQWVRKFFSRSHIAIAEYNDSGWYLNQTLVNQVRQADARDGWMERFLKNPMAEETEVVIRNVVIEELRTQPYRAHVDYELVYRMMPTQTELRREKWTVSIQFEPYRPADGRGIPAELLVHNPLALLITQFHLDQAMPEEKR